MSPLARRSRHPARKRRDEGATLVELSIVALLVFTLFLGIFEFGLLFRDNLTAADAVADATRIGAIIGPDVVDPASSSADYAIVKAVRDGLSALNDSSIQYVVVFKASGSGEDPESQVPTACKRGTSLRGICNSYAGPAAFEAVADGDAAYFTCSGTNTAACPWDPSTRSDGPTSDKVDTLGVYVKINRSGFTGFFGDNWTITRASTIRLEPGITEP